MNDDEKAETHSRAKVKLRRLYVKDGGGKYTEELAIKPYNRDKVRRG